MTLRDHLKTPVKHRWLLRFLYTLALTPVVVVAHSKNLHQDVEATINRLTHEFWQDAHWALSPPTEFWPPLLSFIGNTVGFSVLPGTFIPIISLILAGIILGSVAASLDRRGNLSTTMTIIALALGSTPLFFGPMAAGDAIFWGPGIWFFAIRSMARIESRDMFQHELALGISLAALMILDPAAPLIIVGVFLFLPIILPRNSKRSYLEAGILTISPALMVVFFQISSYAIMHSLPLVQAFHMWSDKLHWSLDYFRMAYPHYDFKGSAGPMPSFLVSALRMTPLIPLAIYLPTIRKRKYHRGTLAAVLVLPLLHGLFYSAYAGIPTHRLWLMYLTLGMIAWLAETPINGRFGKYFTIFVCLWPLVAGWVAVL